MKVRIYSLAILILSYGCHVYADINASAIDHYIDIFTNGTDEQITGVSQDLQWRGISDIRLFDVIENQLKLRYKEADTDSRNPYKVNMVAWLAHALSYSGNMKYIQTLEYVNRNTGNNKIKRHVEDAISELPVHKDRNAVLSDTGSVNIDRYIGIFTGGTDAQIIDACQNLEWLGVSDPRLFDVIEDLLKRRYKEVDTDPPDRGKLNLIVWMIHALGYSGSTKYIPALESISEGVRNNHIKRHVKRTVAEIPKYERWNAIISDTNNITAEKPYVINGIANMLRSDDFELKRLGAKRIHFMKNYDDFLLKTLENELLTNVKPRKRDKIYNDSMRWMIKALAGSGNEAYRASIETVSKETPISGIRKYCAAMLRKYF